MTKKTSCSDLATAIFILSRDIESEDGIANAAIMEAGYRIQELSGQAGVMKKLLIECLGVIAVCNADDSQESGMFTKLESEIKNALAGAE